MERDRDSVSRAADKESHKHKAKTKNKRGLAIITTMPKKKNINKTFANKHLYKRTKHYNDKRRENAFLNEEADFLATKLLCARTFAQHTGLVKIHLPPSPRSPWGGRATPVHVPLIFHEDVCGKSLCV